ncbi:MAG TPA: protein kinase, partial [Thermoanaerobaculia bacterium]|nr:protein kinase [Thermoanaerobaculia bacterium]
MSAPAPFLSRHLGDYLLVAQLSDDPLGTVFRALYAADERRFVRLRVLQSEHLQAAGVLEAARADRLRRALVHEAIVARPELDVVEGVPFMTWDETAGWTLDVMLSRVRAFGIRIPVEYALLIVERIAAALEHAHQTVVDGRPVAHGLLWPGFVAISHDAAVRVGGFGLAEAILPGVAAPRLTEELAPYLAPESRLSARPSTSADVYSLGAILMELVTGRRPSFDTPSTEMRAGDPRSDELSQFLRRCLAEPGERFASGVEAHRALQQMVTGNPFSLFTANLSLFLYKLLNPESQTVAPSSDWESTSPVVLETKTRRADTTGTATATKTPTSGSRTGSPRRRRGDLAPTEEMSAAPALSPDAAPPPVEPFPAAEPAPVEVLEEASRLIEESPEAAPAEPGPFPAEPEAA